MNLASHANEVARTRVCALPALMAGLILLSPLTAADNDKPAADNDKPAADNDKPAADAKTPEVGAVEVRFADNSVLKLRLLDARLTVLSPYGKLEIPIAEIKRVEFATRLPADVTKEIQAAIADLASTEFRKREAATASLRKHREKAYPALLEAAKATDKEVVRRAEALLEEIRDAVPEDKLVFRKFDVIETGHSRISGAIDGTTLKAHTTQFGDVPLRLSEMRSL